MKRYPRWVTSRLWLADKTQDVAVRIIYVSRDERAVTAREDSEVNHGRLCREGEEIVFKRTYVVRRVLRTGRRWPYKRVCVLFRGFAAGLRPHVTSECDDDCSCGLFWSASFRWNAWKFESSRGSDKWRKGPGWMGKPAKKQSDVKVEWERRGLAVCSEISWPYVAVMRARPAEIWPHVRP